MTQTLLHFNFNNILPCRCSAVLTVCPVGSDEPDKYFVWWLNMSDPAVELSRRDLDSEVLLIHLEELRASEFIVVHRIEQPISDLIVGGK